MGKSKTKKTKTKTKTNVKSDRPVWLKKNRYDHNTSYPLDRAVRFDADESKYVWGADRKSRPILTKFERARIIGVRWAQLRRGAMFDELEIERQKKYDGRTKQQQLSDVELFAANKVDLKEIARQELNRKESPFRILRPQHTKDGVKFEVWKVSELSIPQAI